MKKLLLLLFPVMVMAQLQTPISIINLPTATTLFSTDYFIDDQSGGQCPPPQANCTHKASLAQLTGFLGSSFGSSLGANPTASVGLASVNGVATTFMRSDAAPSLAQNINPTWTGIHLFAGAEVTATSTMGMTLGQEGAPSIRWINPSGAADSKIWRLVATGNQLTLDTMSDANAFGANVSAVVRSGTAITTISFGNATNNPVYNFIGSGTVSMAGLTALGAVNLNNAMSVGIGAGSVQFQKPIISAGASHFTIASGTGTCLATGAVTGGVQAGQFQCTTAGTAASTVTLTLLGTLNAYTCWGRDVTTPTTVTQTGAISTTSVTLTLTSVTSNDVIQFGCLGE